MYFLIRTNMTIMKWGDRIMGSKRMMLIIGFLILTSVTFAAPGSLLWWYDVDNQVFASPIPYGEANVVFVTHGGYFVGFNKEGTQLYNVNLGNSVPFFSTPAKLGKYVILISYDGVAYVVDIEASPQPSKMTETQLTTTGSRFMSSPSVYVANGDVESENATLTGFVGDSDGVFYKLRIRVTSTAATITVEATKSLGDDIYCTPLISNDKSKVYVGTKSGVFYKLDTSDLSTLASRTLNGEINSSPAMDDNGNIYVVTSAGYLYSINANNFLVNWARQLSSSVTWSSPVVGISGTTPVVVVGDDHGTVYCYRDDGTVQWTYETGGTVGTSPTIGEAGVVYVGNTAGKLIALNLSDGSEEWEYDVGESIYTSPILPGSEGSTVYYKLYFGTYGGKVYALEVESSRPSGPWPTFKGGTRRQGVFGITAEQTLVQIFFRQGETDMELPTDYYYERESGATGTVSDATYVQWLDYPEAVATIAIRDKAVDVWDSGSVYVPGTDVKYIFSSDPGYGWSDGTSSATKTIEFQYYDTSYILKMKTFFKVYVYHQLTDGSTSSTYSWVHYGESVTLQPTPVGDQVVDHWELTRPDGHSTVVNIPEGQTGEYVLSNVTTPVYAWAYYTKVGLGIRVYMPQDVQGEFDTQIVLNATELRAFVLEIETGASFTIDPTDSTIEVAADWSQLKLSVSSTGASYHYMLSSPASNSSYTGIAATITLKCVASDYISNPTFVFNTKEGYRSAGVSVRVVGPDYEYDDDYWLVGDFNFDEVVNVADLAMFRDHYGLTENDPGWDPLYDIGPRNRFRLNPQDASNKYSVGALVIEDPRVVNEKDLQYFSATYGYELADLAQ